MKFFQYYNIEKTSDLHSHDIYEDKSAMTDENYQIKKVTLIEAIRNRVTWIKNSKHPETYNNDITIIRSLK